MHEEKNNKSRKLSLLLRGVNISASTCQTNICETYGDHIGGRMYMYICRLFLTIWKESWEDNNNNAARKNMSFWLLSARFDKKKTHYLVRLSPILYPRISPWRRSFAGGCQEILSSVEETGSTVTYCGGPLGGSPSVVTFPVKQK